MTDTVRIALDAMGGDHGPDVVAPGASIALSRKPDLSFLFVGDEARIRPLLDADPALKAVSEILHTDVSVTMHDKPSVALRKGRYKSSMWLALEAVKSRKVDAAISAGNTGALMAMSRLCVRMTPGVERPAIAAIWPTLRGESIVLDVGATIGADANQLVSFAVMGAAMARILFDIDRPTVGLLNVGVEEIKGVEQVKEAARLLREKNFSALDFRGFVEGDDLGKGTVDVVVTEGFSGNIALKTAEGTAKQIGEYLRSAISRTMLSKIGYVLAKHAFDTLKEKMDPRKVNGGVFCGLDGVVIKSHGGTDAEGFASAVELGYDMARYDLMEKIRQGFEQDRAAIADAPPEAKPDETPQELAGAAS